MQETLLMFHIKVWGGGGGGGGGFDPVHYCTSTFVWINAYSKAASQTRDEITKLSTTNDGVEQ
ncbi:hypothetical protein ACJX0J_031764, partial [Zea mays]